MPIDYTTPAGQVRLLCTDVSEPYAFTDEAISAFLSLTGDNVKRSAALALRTIAADEALLVKVVRTDDLSVNGAQTAEALRRQADDLEAQADREDAATWSEGFVIHDPGYPRFGGRQVGAQPEGAATWV